MRLSPATIVKAWSAAKKEGVYPTAILAGVLLFLIFAAPYCC